MATLSRWLLALAVVGANQALDPGADATRFLQWCRDGQFAEAAGRFDATVAAALPAAKLEATWKGLTTASGPLVRFGPPRISKRGDLAVVLVRCEFSRAALDAQVGFDAEGKINGLFFKPAAAPAKPAPYVDPAKYTETTLTVGAEGWPLGATLALPVGPGSFPAVVLVHGSGPNDRDETIGANAPFRDLAQGLATQGVATLRYDKRTRVHAARMKDAPPTLEAEVIADALAAVAKVRTLDRIDSARVFVLGHSLGAVLAPTVARRDGKLAGVVWMAGNVRPLDAVVLDQVHYLSRPEAKPDPATVQFARTTEGEVAAFRTDPNRADGTLMGGPYSYWREITAVHPDRDLADQPTLAVLALQGGRDYQVTPKEFDLLRAALPDRANAAFELYPALNHLFLAGEGPPGPAEYGKPGHVDPAVVERIAAWIKAGR